MELYDIPKDPMELNNLAGRHVGIADRLSLEAMSWQGTLPEGPVDPEAGSNAYPWPKTRKGIDDRQRKPGTHS